MRIVCTRGPCGTIPTRCVFTTREESRAYPRSRPLGVATVPLHSLCVLDEQLGSLTTHNQGARSRLLGDVAGLGFDKRAWDNEFGCRLESWRHADLALPIHVPDSPNLGTAWR